MCSSRLARSRVPFAGLLPLSPLARSRSVLLIPVTLFSVSVFLVWQPPRRDVLHGREREKENSGNVAWLARSHTLALLPLLLSVTWTWSCSSLHTPLRRRPLFLILPRPCAASACPRSIPQHRETRSGAHTRTRPGDDTACTGRNAHRQSHALDVCTSRAHSAPRCPTIRERFSNCPKLLGYNSSSYRRADTILRGIKRHGTLRPFYRYSFVSRTCEPDELVYRSVTLRPSLTRGSCVHLVSAHRGRNTVALSLSLLLALSLSLWFEHTHCPHEMFCSSSVLHGSLDTRDEPDAWLPKQGRAGGFQHARRSAHPQISRHVSMSPSELLSLAGGGGSHIAIAVRDTVRAPIGGRTRGIARTPIGRVHLLHWRHLSGILRALPFALLIGGLESTRLERSSSDNASNRFGEGSLARYEG